MDDRSKETLKGARPHSDKGEQVLRTERANTLRSPDAVRPLSAVTGAGAAFDAEVATATSSNDQMIQDVVGVSVVGASVLFLESADRATRDRRARQRSVDILGLLGALQRALLDGGAGEDTSLDRLSALLSVETPADDPGLGDLLMAVETRAAVEAARRGR